MRLGALLAVAMFTQSAAAGEWSPELEARYGYDWSGAYVGAFGGLGISSGRAVLGDHSGVLIPVDVEYGLFPRSIERNDAGGVAGVAAGFNFQSGSFVGGVEADIGYAKLSPHHSYSRIDNVPGSPFPGVSTNTAYATEFGTLATLRARGGYAFGDTLVFGTAGLAAGHVHNRFELALPEIGYSSPDWSGSGMRLGYAVGIGIEHRVTSNVSLKLETLYVNLADRTVRGTDPAAFPGEAISYRFTNDMLLPRVGIGVKF